MLSDISLFDNVRQTHARFHCDYFAINLCISISLSKMNRILLLTHFTRSVTRPSLATLPQTMCHRQFCSKPKLPSMLEVKRIERRPEYRDGATKSDIDWNYEMQEIYKEENSHSLLDPVQDEQSIDVEPQIAMTFNLAAYANKLPALQQLLKLGVNLYKIERRKGLAKYLVTLDFERHMKEHIFFLTKVVGLDVDLLGAFLTKNPLIFRESIDDLQTRINYLESKKFTPSDIAYIIQMNPFWLMFSVKRIDARLGFFQREFELTGNQVRQLTLKSPRLITYRLETIRELTFVVREEMEWPKDETRALLLKCPKMWLIRNTIFYAFALCALNSVHSIC